MAVLSIAFAWAHKVGDWRHENQKPIKAKNHGRLSVSYFRYGLDWIRQALLAGQSRFAQLKCTIGLLNAAILGGSVDAEPGTERLC